MALKYPIVVKIGIPVTIVLLILFHVIKKKGKFKGGIRVANADYARQLPEYKKYRTTQLFLRTVLEFCIIAAVIASLYLIARPVKTETVSNGTRKRDIYLCLDVSYSICYLNSELVDNLRDVVKSLDGDRFGITIYNTSTVLYVPMTDDYDFILKKLEDLKKYFELQREYVENYWGAYYYNLDERYYELSEQLGFYDAGTLVNNYTKGSSLIGEGLASCLFSFPHLDDENRSRIIIMSTDNAQEALSKPLVELDEASDMCCDHDVTIFGIFPNEEVFEKLNDPTKDYGKLADDLRDASEKTGGAFYKQSDSFTVKDIVNDISSQKVMEVNEITINKVVDKPAVPIWILIISIILIIITGALILI